MEPINKIINSALSPQENEWVYRSTESCAVDSAKCIDPAFIVDEAIKPTMRALCLYFGNDPRFEEEGNGKLSKGIFLCGNVGTGKTLLMNAFKKNTYQTQRYLIVNSNFLNDEFMIHGVEGLEEFFGKCSVYNGGYPRVYCFNDLGSENPSIKHMGNELSVMGRIILARYDKRVPFSFTHFTSNIDGEEIEKIYGTRVRSRIREMCNFLVLDGNDRRK